MEKWRKLWSNEKFVGYTFVLPNFLGFLLFTSLPVIASLILSFMNWDIINEPEWAGLDNFVNLLGFHKDEGAIVANDPDFWMYLYNTVYMMLIIPLCMIGSLLLALLLNREIKGIVAFRAIYFLPSICAGVAVCLLWKWLLNSNYEIGLINSAIATVASWFGKDPNAINYPKWLVDPALAKPALMIMSFWSGIGGMNMILYLAALQNVPQELYEAADIDGASSFQKFWKITLPFLSPTTFFITIMSIIGGFQGGFTQAFVMTEGGPAGSTTTIEYYLYNNAYSFFQMGYAAAIAWVIFIIVLILTAINWKYGGKMVHY